MKVLFDLFRAFFTIGALTFGGGYAMLPMLEREIVNKHKWATQEELLNYFAIGQCTLGVIAPSILIITVIALVLENFMEITWVQNAFAGIRVAVCALITASVVKLVKSNVKKYWHIALAVMAFVVVALLDLSPVYVVVGCAVLSFIFGKKVRKA